MSITHKPFYRTRTDEERALDKSSHYTLRLTKPQEAVIFDAGRFCQQVKPGTLIKVLALIAARDVLRDKKTQDLLVWATNNVRRNMETGVPVEMPSDRDILGNVNESD